MAQVHRGDPVHGRAAKLIHRARKELKSVLPEDGKSRGFGPAHATALFAKAAGDLHAVEILLGEEMTSSAAIVHRSFLFSAIRLKWFAGAGSRVEVEARVVAFIQSSLLYEKGLLAKVRASEEDKNRTSELEQYIDAELQMVRKWKSENAVGKRKTDEVAIADVLKLHDLIATIALLDQHAHVNRVSTNATVQPDSETPSGYVVRSRPLPELAQVILTSAMRGLGYAAVSFLELIDADQETIMKAEVAAGRWIAEAVGEV